MQEALKSVSGSAKKIRMISFCNDYYSPVQAILFLRSLQRSIEFNSFLSLGSNTISFYTVAFHFSFHHFHRYTIGFCPWPSSLFIVHKPYQSNLYQGFNFISSICWRHEKLHFIFTQPVLWLGLPPLKKKLRDSERGGLGLTVWGRGSEKVYPC